ncbi:MAG TPA: hypothetical protein EYN00_04505 [Planctomycetes bacterium]|nr:hypothetical protein [Planctomycetota bacterium]
MNECRDIRDRLHEWVDGELDPILAADIHRHIDDCVDCADTASAIEKIKALIQTKARRVNLPPDLEDRVRQSLAIDAHRQRGQKSTSVGSRWLLAAAILLALFLLPFLPGLIAPDELHAQVAEEVFDSHLRTVMEGELPQFLCDTSSGAAATIKEKLGIDVVLPEFPEGSAALLGVTFLECCGIKVGKAFYRLKGDPFTVFVVPMGCEQKPTLCICKRGKNYSVLCNPRDGYCLVMVTGLRPEEFQEDFLASVVPEASGTVGK